MIIFQARENNMLLICCYRRQKDWNMNNLNFCYDVIKQAWNIHLFWSVTPSFPIVWFYVWWPCYVNDPYTTLAKQDIYLSFYISPSVLQRRINKGQWGDIRWRNHCLAGEVHVQVCVKLFVTSEVKDCHFIRKHFFWGIFIIFFVGEWYTQALERYSNTILIVYAINNSLSPFPYLYWQARLYVVVNNGFVKPTSSWWTSFYSLGPNREGNISREIGCVRELECCTRSPNTLSDRHHWYIGHSDLSEFVHRPDIDLSECPSVVKTTRIHIHEKGNSWWPNYDNREKLFWVVKTYKYIFYTYRSKLPYFTW